MSKVFVVLVVFAALLSWDSELYSQQAQNDQEDNATQEATSAIKTAADDISASNQLLAESTKRIAELEKELASAKLQLKVFETLELTELQKQSLTKRMAIVLIRDASSKKMDDGNLLEGILLQGMAEVIEDLPENRDAKKASNNSRENKTNSQTKQDLESKKSKRKQLLSAIFALEREIPELTEEVAKHQKTIDECNRQLNLYYRSAANRDTRFKKVAGGFAAGFYINRKSDAQKDLTNSMQRLREKRSYLQTLKIRLLEFED